MPLASTLQDSYYKSSFLRHLPVFAFGIFACRLFEQFIEHKPLSRTVGSALLLGSFYGYHALLRGTLGQVFTDPYYWRAVIYGLALLGLAFHPTVVVVNRVTSYLGRISYSLYLFHPSVILFMFPLYRWIEAQSLPATLSFGVCAALTLTTVTGISALTYRYVEEPGLRLSRRVVARLTAGANPRIPVPL